MSILDKFRLDGKTALVTGCRRGIGKAMSIALAEAGADVVGVSANLPSAGSDVEQAVKALGRDFKAYTCDFANRDDVYEFIARVKAECPPIDILVNNAGMVRNNPVEAFTDADWDAVLEVNLTASFILSREFGKDMIRRGGGKIIYTASLLTFQGGVTASSYAASKGGIGQITKALSNEWASKGIQVNAIAPGYIETDIAADLTNDPVTYKEFQNRIPLGRWGQPEDIMGTVVYLASAASDYVTGEILLVDGGWLGR
jgi:2-dehydro-3-deoxy-D-gluconate 5-dehydrogenase